MPAFLARLEMASGYDADLSRILRKAMLSSPITAGPNRRVDLRWQLERFAC
jgi:hypothetical protein